MIKSDNRIIKLKQKYFNMLMNDVNFKNAETPKDKVEFLNNFFEPFIHLTAPLLDFNYFNYKKNNTYMGYYIENLKVNEGNVSFDFIDGNVLGNSLNVVRRSYSFKNHPTLLSNILKSTNSHVLLAFVKESFYNQDFLSKFYRLDFSILTTILHEIQENLRYEKELTMLEQRKIVKVKQMDNSKLAPQFKNDAWLNAWLNEVNDLLLLTYKQKENVFMAFISFYEASTERALNFLEDHPEFDYEE